ncbi:MAG: nucleotide sugar dehydrogenase [bacterium]|nr:nucleotide sugar dehydrogenase [bacterium]MDD5353583.1 nucleotide sugar dehydrogenase [bacterium]
MHEERLKKILEKKAKAGIIGLGYVGLPLAVELAKVGFDVTGIDVDQRKTDSINKGISYIQDVPSAEVRELVKAGKLRATTDFSVLKHIDTINICVPTPLRKSKDPDISYILAATTEIAKYLHKGQLIILESTTYPGTTEEVMQPMLEAKGLKAGRDFHLAFSPERVDPGNPQFNTKNITKVVGGYTPKCTALAVALYSQAIDKVLPVSSTRVAETVKLLENTFRSVNIGMVNEMAIICNKLGINVWEVIDAAATKPFGFMPFYPGPGIGGHCIPLDPHYLSWRVRLEGYDAKFIELAGQINRSMPEYVINKLNDALNNKGKSVKNAKILVLGVAYKNDIDDVRESPAIDFIKLLQKKGAKVNYHDPFIPNLGHEGVPMKSVPLTKSIVKSVDAVVVITRHKAIDYKWLVANAKLVIDTRNATKSLGKRNNVVKL